MKRDNRRAKVLNWRVL